MHLANFLAALSLAGAVVALKPLKPRVSRVANNATIVETKRFIIEFAKDTDHAALRADIASREGTSILKVFDSDVFSGVSVEATVESTDTLQAIKSVSNVWQSKKILLNPTIGLKGFSDDATAPDYDIHHMTGVDKLHDAGVLGKGVIVAIVDTGVQYTHPALGGGFGPGFKVAGGYDLVGDQFWPSVGYEKEPDSDPFDTNGHGTHVAGIVAGQSEHWVGVAPEATIYSYKVFSNADGTDEDTLIEAFLMAQADGADIITASVGGIGGWTQNAWAVVASRLVETGIVVTIAAGNSGQEGMFFGSTGSSGINVLAVASVDADVLPASLFLGTFNLDGAANTTQLSYLPGLEYFPSEVSNWPIIAPSLDATDASVGCSPLPADTPDLSNALVLLPRGECEFAQKQINAQAFGARYILFYNNDWAMEYPNTYEWNSIIGLTENRVGVAIIETLKAGGSVSVDFSLNPETNYGGIVYSAGGIPSYFTSLGGTYDLSLKPDVAAPGGNIFSSYLDGSYAILSGTSMATPYIAGVAALYIGKFGGRSAHGPGFGKELSMRIISSGSSVKWNDGATDTDYGFWAPVPQVGTGLVNAVKVLDYSTSLSWAKFALNDTRHFERYHSVDITNHGSETVTYKFLVQEAGGVEAVDNGFIPAVKGGPGLEPFLPTKMSPSVSLPGGTFTVKPGQTKTAKFNFQLAEGLSTKNMPVYSGKILIVGSNDEQLAVPYMGIAADTKKLFDSMWNEGLPSSMSTLWFTPIEEKSTYTFNLSIDSRDGQDFPRILASYRWGVDQLRWDIFEAGWKERDWKYPPVVGENGYVGSATSWLWSGYWWYIDPAVDNPDDLISFPLTQQPRGFWSQWYNEYWWLGKMADGTRIAPGNYTMRFAVLNPFGSPERGDNWSVYKTPQIQVI